jgi:ureidoglycolate hydrolase
LTPSPRPAETSFRPYGGLIAANLTIPSFLTPPGAQKSLEVVPTSNLYSSAPSGVPGRHVIHVERVEPKQFDVKQRSLLLERMERHPFTSQSFVPMGSEVRYLAIVADGCEEEDKPDLRTLKVFSVGEGEGVCYEAF